jgi:hypothetical protein
LCRFLTLRDKCRPDITLLDSTPPLHSGAVQVDQTLTCWSEPPDLKHALIPLKNIVKNVRRRGLRNRGEKRFLKALEH